VDGWLRLGSYALKLEKGYNQGVALLALCSLLLTKLRVHCGLYECMQWSGLTAHRRRQRTIVANVSVSSATLYCTVASPVIHIVAAHFTPYVQTRGNQLQHKLVSQHCDAMTVSWQQ